ncbi:MAG: hypothetical protein IKF22_09760, partial [Lachnospiraceae bacterium]|nr:hypothetical protein [Lachnospiraceae bacterium]
LAHFIVQFSVPFVGFSIMEIAILALPVFMDDNCLFLIFGTCFIKRATTPLNELVASQKAPAHLACFYLEYLLGRERSPLTHQTPQRLR